jgi:hypothetical protein
MASDGSWRSADCKPDNVISLNSPGNTKAFQQKVSKVVYDDEATSAVQPTGANKVSSMFYFLKHSQSVDDESNAMTDRISMYFSNVLFTSATPIFISGPNVISAAGSTISIAGFGTSSPILVVLPTGITAVKLLITWSRDRLCYAVFFNGSDNEKHVTYASKYTAQPCSFVAKFIIKACAACKPGNRPTTSLITMYDFASSQGLI